MSKKRELKVGDYLYYYDYLYGKPRIIRHKIVKVTPKRYKIANSTYVDKETLEVLGARDWTGLRTTLCVYEDIPKDILEYYKVRNIHNKINEIFEEYYKDKNYEKIEKFINKLKEILK